MLKLLIPILIAITLVVAITTKTVEWDFFSLGWSLFMAAFGSFFLVQCLLLAQTITIREDGQLEFRKIRGTIVLRPADIHAIGPSGVRRFLSIRTSQGIFLIPNEWTGLHEFIEFVRRSNENLRLKGM